MDSFLIRNPILNSADDITEDLIKRIISNDLDSLTINYEFTSRNPNIPFSEWEIQQLKINPFRIANKVKELRKIEFKVILGTNVHDLSGAFMKFNKLEYVNLQNTSNITNMGSLFAGDPLFNQFIGNWDTSNVTNMRAMFEGCVSFNQPIHQWNTSKVKIMDAMFHDAKSFNQPIGNWNTSNVNDMQWMFKNASSFDQYVGGWDTRNVTNMESMFESASMFNKPLRDWNTSKVKNMRNMFANASLFNQPINNWDTRNVTDMSNMFILYSSYSYPKPKFYGSQNINKSGCLPCLLLMFSALCGLYQFLSYTSII